MPNPFRNILTGYGTPLIDRKHVTADDLAEMTPEQIAALPYDKFGDYQSKYLHEDKFSPEQKEAIKNKLGEKTHAKVSHRPLYGGRTRRRKGRKGRKSRRKSRRSRK